MITFFEGFTATTWGCDVQVRVAQPIHSILDVMGMQQVQSVQCMWEAAILLKSSNRTITIHNLHEFR